MKITRQALITLTAATVILSGPTAMAQSAGEVLGPAAVAPLKEQQPPAKIILDPPLAEPLSHGLVFIQYRTEHLRIVPVFGLNALDVSPRIGHIHVTVDDAPWHWADASGEPLIAQALVTVAETENVPLRVSAVTVSATVVPASAVASKTFRSMMSLLQVAPGTRKGTRRVETYISYSPGASPGGTQKSTVTVMVSV